VLNKIILLLVLTFVLNAVAQGAKVETGVYQMWDEGIITTIALKPDKSCVILSTDTNGEKGLEDENLTDEKNVWFHLKNGDALLTCYSKKGFPILRTWVRRVGDKIQIYKMSVVPFRPQDTDHTLSRLMEKKAEAN
jgi:hypothetical protein